MADRTVKVTLTASVSNYLSAMRQAQQETQKTGSEAEKLAQKKDAFRQLGAGMLVVGGAITAVGIAAAKTGIEYNTLQQKSRAALTTLLGGAKAANEQMDKLDTFARSSPFAKQVFISAQQQMLAFGIETKKVIPYLDAVQNAVAAAGGSSAEIGQVVEIMAKIKSSAKITAVDLMQFGNHGVDAAGLIGKAMGKTGAQIRDDISNGALDAQTALDALAKGMAERYKGAAANVKETFVGSLDRVKAAWRDFSSSLMTPFVNPRGGGMFVDLLNGTADLMRAFIALPEPVRNAAGVITFAGGAALVAGGAFLLAVPKIAAFKAAMALLAGDAAVAGGRLKEFGAFMAGPWGVAIVAATAGLMVLDNYLKSVQASSSEMQNAIKSATSAQQIFAQATRGMDVKYWTDASASIKDLNQVLDVAARRSQNYFSTFGSVVAMNSQRAAEDSLHRIGDELGKLAATNLPAAQRGFEIMASRTDGSQQSLWRLLSNMEGYKKALIEEATQQGINVTSSDQAANKRNLLALATGQASEASKANAKALAELSGKASDADVNIDKLAKTIAGFGKGALDVSSAQIAFADAVDKASQSVKDNGTNLDINTKQGRDNQTALDGIANSATSLISAYTAQGMSEANLQIAMQASRDQFVKAAMQMGLTADQANALADKYNLIPRSVSTAISQTGAAEVMGAAKGVKDAVDAIPLSKQVKIFVEQYGMPGVSAPGVGVLKQANGGMLDFYKNGGMRERHVAQIAPAGSWRVWGEPETGGESYIPLAASKRQRSLQIWQETGRRLGVQGFAGGGITYVPAAPSVTSNVTVRTSDRPIYMDGSLFGTLRELANGEARIVVNDARQADAAAARRGKVAW